MNELNTDSAPAGAAKEARLANGTLVAYSLPATGVAFLGLMISVYYFKFAVDDLLVAPAVLGTIFMIARIWDAISDPLTGYLSDRTTTRLGRRRPWLVASILPIAAFSLMPWSPPAGLEGAWLIAWLVVGLLLFETASTAFTVPHTALAAELSLDHHERTRIFAFRYVGVGIGFVALAGAMQLMTTTDDPRGMAQIIMLWGGGVTALLIVVSVARVRERPEHSGRGPKRPVGAVLDVWRNHHSRLLLVVLTIESMGAASLGLLGPFVMEYVVGDESLFPVLLMCFFVPTLLFIPFALPISRRLGKKRTWLAGMALSGASFGLLVFVGPDTLWITFVAGPGAGIGMAIGSMIGPSVKADIVDVDELLTGERKEGLYYAVWNFSRKCAGGIMGGVTGLVLQWVGFEPNAEQSEATLRAIVLLFGLLPASGYLIGVLIFWRFGLTEQEHARVRAELDRRASSSDDFQRP